MHAQVATFADGGLEKSSVGREFSAKSCHAWWMIRISKDFFIFANEVGPWNPTFCDIWAWFKKKLTLQIGVVPHQMTVAFFCQLVLQLEISSRDLMEKDGQQQAAVDFIKSSGGWWLAIGGTMVPSRMFCFRRWNDMGILGLTMPKWQNCSAEFGCRDCH